MKTLSKPCRCIRCEQLMEVGEEFTWSQESVLKYESGSGRGFHKEVWKPKHPFDCLTPLLAEERRLNEIAALRETRKNLRGYVAQEYGMDVAVKSYKAHRGLDVE